MNTATERRLSIIERKLETLSDDLRAMARDDSGDLKTMRIRLRDMADRLNPGIEEAWSRMGKLITEDTQGDPLRSTTGENP